MSSINELSSDNGLNMYKLAERLFPISRSLTGKGIHDSYEIIREENPEFKYLNFKTGKKVFDWEIPYEWNINDAYIKHESGEKFCEFKKNNLHVVGYSTNINIKLTKEELIKKLFYRKDLPNAIPYVTSYYRKDWGFCITYDEYKNLPNGLYTCYIDSTLKQGKLSLIEAVIPGKSSKEIFFSSYLCHPSMANNELSGPVLISELMKYVKHLKDREFTYRFVLLPETIGSIAYLSKRADHLKKNVICGYNLTCCGDNKRYTHIQSREANTVADQGLIAALRGKENVITKSFLERGSDERQYNSPGIDLPLCGFSRSKFGDYDEYHTSLDNLDFISDSGLQGSFNIMQSIIDAFEIGFIPKSNFICEPQLGKRNLYPSISQVQEKDMIKNNRTALNLRMDLIAYSDGKKNIFEITNIIGFKLKEVIHEMATLKKASILSS